MNTGRVGGPDGVEGSRKVRIPHSSAIVKGIAEGTIEWERDPDFGYEVASARAGPRRRRPRGAAAARASTSAWAAAEEYRGLVERFRAERREYLAKFPGLGEEIVRAV